MAAITERLLVNAVQLEEFTTLELSLHSEVSLQTVQTTLARKSEYFDKFPDQSQPPSRGGQRLRYRIKKEAADKIRSQYEQLFNAPVLPVKNINDKLLDEVTQHSYFAVNQFLHAFSDPRMEEDTWRESQIKLGLLSLANASDYGQHSSAKFSQREWFIFTIATATGELSRSIHHELLEGLAGRHQRKVIERLLGLKDAILDYFESVEPTANDRKFISMIKLSEFYVLAGQIVHKEKPVIPHDNLSESLFMSILRDSGGAIIPDSADSDTFRICLGGFEATVCTDNCSDREAIMLNALSDLSVVNERVTTTGVEAKVVDEYGMVLKVVKTFKRLTGFQKYTPFAAA